MIHRTAPAGSRNYPAYSASGYLACCAAQDASHSGDTTAHSTGADSLIAVGDNMGILKSSNLAIRFLLELCVLALVGYWGYRAGNSQTTRIGLAMLTTIVVAAIWTLFGAPKASFALSGPAHLLVEIAVFGSGVAALLATGHPGAAIALTAIIIVNRALMHVWRQ
ncbi:MAG: YrdB family protein [Thermomicrobiales bacterium]